MMITSHLFLRAFSSRVFFSFVGKNQKLNNLNFLRYAHTEIIRDLKSPYRASLTYEKGEEKISLKADFNNINKIFLKIMNSKQEKSEKLLLSFKEYRDQYLMSFESYKNDVLAIEPEIDNKRIDELYEKHCLSRYRLYLRTHDTDNNPATIL